MFSAAVRVLARAAAIQLEEIAAQSRTAASIKGKERAHAETDVARQHVEQMRQTARTRSPAASQSGKRQQQQVSQEAPAPQSAPIASAEPGSASSSDVGLASSSGSRSDGESPAESSSAGSHFQSSHDAVRMAQSSREPETAARRLLRTRAEDDKQREAVASPRAAELHSTGRPSDSLPVESTMKEAAVRTRAQPIDVGNMSEPESTPVLDPMSVSADAQATQDEREDEVMLRASTVPSSRIGRLFHYGSLAASLGWGAASESIRRSAGRGSSGSVFMSDANVRRLVASLSRMRGAALKLGQFMSIQDNHMLPPEIERVLQQVQSQANYMPDWQMEKVMSTELGSDWPSLFSSFDRTPIASASIGQVHRATLPSGTPAAVKIQFPGIKDSISSDLSYLTPILRSSAVLPKGLYLQNTIAVMKRELADECDYLLEAEAGRRFGRLLEGDEFFDVPRVVDEATTERVLTTEWMEGKPLSRMKGMSQETRDKIGHHILRLCLLELFRFRFMQTDPNWANFLYNASTDRLGLIDFGASREYSKTFMDEWYRLLRAAVRGEKGEMKRASREIGYLTGEENEEMLEAHLLSMTLVASPFAHPGPYAFANQTITDSVRALIPIMLRYRLTPPPRETYSLNRKLSGAFLMCARLGARVDCGKLWEDYVEGYQIGEEDGGGVSGGDGDGRGPDHVDPVNALEAQRASG